VNLVLCRGPTAGSELSFGQRARRLQTPRCQTPAVFSFGCPGLGRRFLPILHPRQRRGSPESSSNAIVSSNGGTVNARITSLGVNHIRLATAPTSGLRGANARQCGYFSGYASQVFVILSFIVKYLPCLRVIVGQDNAHGFRGSRPTPPPGTCRVGPTWRYAQSSAGVPNRPAKSLPLV
jgi:hypothetical protein